MKYKTYNLILSLCILLANILACTLPASCQDQVKTHVVRDLDNYYSLSLKYNVSIDDLKAANPGIEIPMPGDVLIIPSPETRSGDVPGVDCKRSKKNDRSPYKIALMIPFYLQQVDDSLWSDKIGHMEIQNITPFRFIQFYHGFMVALDSLQKQGFNAEVHVYDVDQQAIKLNAVLMRPEMKNMDLIVGPFFKTCFAQAAKFARDNKIPIVNPLSTREDILYGNPYVFKLMPSVESQAEFVADLVSRDFRNHRIIFYVANKYQDRELAELYKQAIEHNDLTGKQKVYVVDFLSDSIQGFLDHASFMHPNLVIILAMNEVLPALLLSKLNEANDIYRITVIGLPEWKSSPTLSHVIS